MIEVGLQTHEADFAHGARARQAQLCDNRNGSLLGAGFDLPMHQHLRAWRKFRGLSLEQVGDSLGKKHSSVSRWERGLMKLSTADLDALARVYGVSMRELTAPPHDPEMLATLDRAQSIIKGLEPQALEQWLSIGETLTITKHS